MDFYKHLDKGVSKYAMNLIADEIEANPNRIKELVEIIIENKKGISWRAAYSLDELSARNYSFFEKYADELIEFTLSSPDISTQRHLCKLISKYPVKEKHQGKLLDFCTEKINSDKVKVAVKVHCIEIFYNISVVHPELKHELELIINDVMNKNTVAFSCRAKKILKKIKK